MAMAQPAQGGDKRQLQPWLPKRPGQAPVRRNWAKRPGSARGARRRFRGHQVILLRLTGGENTGRKEFDINGLHHTQVRAKILDANYISNSPPKRAEDRQA